MAEPQGSAAPASGEPANAPTNGEPQPNQGQPANDGGAGQQPQQGQQGQPTSVMGGGQPQQPQQSDQPQQPQQPQQGNTVIDQITDTNLKSDPNLQHIKSIDDLAKSYVHAQGLVGKDKLVIPSNDDDPAWNDVLGKLGRPESPDKYELPKPAEDSEVQLPEGMDQQFAQKAHKLGLTNKQARDLFGWYIQDVAEPELNQVSSRLQEQAQEAETQLRKEFGNAFDEKVQNARRAVETYGGQDVLNKLAQSGLGNDPEVVKMFAKLGDGLREDTVGGSSTPAGRTPDQALQEINQKMTDPSFRKTYLTSTEPGHKEAVEQIRRLYADAYPNQK